MNNSKEFKLQGEIKIQGLNIKVENRKGSVRKGTDPDGHEWSIKMKYPYGYISRTKASDGEHVDCYVGDSRESNRVYVIHQVNPKNGEYDEDKVMLGFETGKQAKQAYLDHYDSPKFFGSMSIMSIERLRESLKENKGKKLEKAMTDTLIKGGKGLPIGTKKTHADGMTRIKTAQGWRPYTEKHSHLEKESLKTSDAILEVAATHSDPHDRMKALISKGVKDPQILVDATKLDRSEVISYMKDHNVLPQSSTVSAEELNQKLDKPPVAERWKAYNLFLDMVASGLGKSAISYGTGGVGKTFTMKQVLVDKHNLMEFDTDSHMIGSDDYDFVKITGKSTPMAMYKALYEHNGKIVVFDDCDSVLKDETSINILKGALDTTGDGTVSYASGKTIKNAEGEAIPQRFAFNGRAIFISNLSPKEMPQPLRSRSLTIDLTMTAGETVQMMRSFVHKMPFQDNNGNPIEVSEEDRQDAIDFMDNIKDKMDIGDLNARTLGQIALIKKKVRESNLDLDWEVAAMAMLS